MSQPTRLTKRIKSDSSMDQEDNDAHALYSEMRELAAFEKREYEIDVDTFAPVEPKVWRVRGGRPKMDKKAGTKIVRDLDGVKWYIRDPRKSCDWGGASMFDLLPSNLVVDIVLMAMDRPRDHYNLSLSCRAFSQICEKPRVVAHTAARATRKARLQSKEAALIAEAARNEAQKDSAKVIEFETGKWHGVRSRSKVPSGLGVYRDHATGYLAAGRYKKGDENGPFEIRYADGSSYKGNTVNGYRQGDGVQWTGRGERHEGSWVKDGREGYGLMLGGAYPFMFGRYKGDEPVGKHIAWDIHTDTVLLQF